MHSLDTYHFKGQLPDEIILKVIRRHWFDILWHFLPVIFTALALSAATIVVPPIAEGAIFGGRVLVYFFASIFFMALWSYASILWVDYYLDVWIITNKRVVNVEQKNLFMRDVSELQYRTIQDITTEVNGVIATFLDFGNVYIQTAAEKPRFLFRNVPHPYEIKGTLMEMQKRYRKREINEERHILHGGGSA